MRICTSCHLSTRFWVLCERSITVLGESLNDVRNQTWDMITDVFVEFLKIKNLISKHCPVFIWHIQICFHVAMRLKTFGGSSSSVCVERWVYEHIFRELSREFDTCWNRGVQCEFNTPINQRESSSLFYYIIPGLVGAKWKPSLLSIKLACKVRSKYFSMLSSIWEKKQDTHSLFCK